MSEPMPIVTDASEEVFPHLWEALGDIGRDALGDDLIERRKIGIATYKVPLMTHNGLNATRYKFEELLDALFYHVQECKEEGVSIYDEEFFMLKRFAMNAKAKLVAQEAKSCK